MLIGQSYRSLPVVDEAHRIVGILTDGDLLARLGLPDASVQSALTAAEFGRELDALRRSGKTVREVMVSPVITTTEDAAVGDAVRSWRRTASSVCPSWIGAAGSSAS